jgi:hypothetical protein
LLVAAVAAAAACAPIQTTVATNRAKDNMYKAGLADADDLKPGEKYITPAQYEYQLAYLYLEKSKELQGFSKFDAATFYASRAATLSAKAREHKGDEERRKIRRQQIRSGQIIPKDMGREQP